MALTKVLTGGIADNAITASKIPANAVTNSELKLDADYAFTGTVTGAGVSSATSTLPSEGGAATTIVSQGLTKAWVNLKTTDTFATRDSFNVTSTADNGAGDYTVTIANDFSNANYCLATNAGDKHASVLGFVGLFGTTAPSATAVRLGGTATNGNNYDHVYHHNQMVGDLA
tara:strand:+ start:38 stop:553 length:516 start_codon:yes stop_codon:yes gene_type:complete